MTLHLLPNLLAEGVSHPLFLPQSVDMAVASLDGLIAESVAGGRRYLKHFSTKKPPHEMPIALLSEPVDFLLEPVLKGEQWGVVSDAGLPCLADPGAMLVRYARQKRVAIRTYPGPSSITMALVLSGLPGQKFTFHGYLPKDPAGRRQALQNLERVSLQEKSTQIFIEAPYRNQHTWAACLEVLRPQTWLTVALDLTAPSEFIETKKVEKWKQETLLLEKRPAIFLVCAV